MVETDRRRTKGRSNSNIQPERGNKFFSLSPRAYDADGQESTVIVSHGFGIGSQCQARIDTAAPSRSGILMCS
jgi:hypothetical protein